MAASVSSGDDDSELSDINVTPLVDVVLVLLIVFMITIPQVVGATKVDVELPTSRAIAGADEIPPMTIWIRPAEDGGVVVAINEQTTTREGLPALIQEIGIPDPEMAVMLRADARISYADVVSVMDILNSIGIRKLALDTKHVDR
jgi:biopolymer transport protein ExbD